LKIFADFSKIRLNFIKKAIIDNDNNVELSTTTTITTTDYQQVHNLTLLFDNLKVENNEQKQNTFFTRDRIKIAC
jgi:hypothetical protein